MGRERIHLIECEVLVDGRTLPIVRVDHPPHHLSCTQAFRMDKHRVVAIDEYRMTAEAAPAWRDLFDSAVRQRFGARAVRP